MIGLEHVPPIRSIECYGANPINKVNRKEMTLMPPIYLSHQSPHTCSANHHHHRIFVLVTYSNQQHSFLISVSGMNSTTLVGFDTVFFSVYYLTWWVSRIWIVKLVWPPLTAIWLIRATSRDLHRPKLTLPFLRLLARSRQLPSLLMPHVGIIISPLTRHPLLRKHPFNNKFHV